LQRSGQAVKLLDEHQTPRLGFGRCDVTPSISRATAAPTNRRPPRPSRPRPVAPPHRKHLFSLDRSSKKISASTELSSPPSSTKVKFVVHEQAAIVEIGGADRRPIWRQPAVSWGVAPAADTGRSARRMTGAVNRRRAQPMARAAHRSYRAQAARQPPRAARRRAAASASSCQERNMG
jgi:hypothetical protein